MWCAGCRPSGGSVLEALLWSQCVHGTPIGVSQPAQLPVVNAAHLTLGAKGLCVGRASAFSCPCPG